MVCCRSHRAADPFVVRYLGRRPRAHTIERLKSRRWAVQLRFHLGSVFYRQVVQHIPLLMNLTSLNESRLAGVPLHRRMQCLAAIQYIETRNREVQSPLHQLAQQIIHRRQIFLSPPSRNPSTVFLPSIGKGGKP